MRTTIDAAGRIVVPKSLREAMQLRAGQAIDIVYTDGRLEIEVAPASVTITEDDDFPVVTYDDDVPLMDERLVRATLEDTRR